MQVSSDRAPAILLEYTTKSTCTKRERIRQKEATLNLHNHAISQRFYGDILLGSKPLVGSQDRYADPIPARTLRNRDYQNWTRTSTSSALRV